MAGNDLRKTPCINIFFQIQLIDFIQCVYVDSSTYKGAMKPWMNAISELSPRCYTHLLFGTYLSTVFITFSGKSPATSLIKKL